MLQRPDAPRNDHGVAVVVYPTLPVTSRPVKDIGGTIIELNGEYRDTKATLTRNTDFASLLGLPSITLPAGLCDVDPTSAALATTVSATPRAPVSERPVKRPGVDSERLPVGLEVTGPRGSDELLLGVAKAIQGLQPLIADPVARARWSTGVNLF